MGFTQEESAVKCNTCGAESNDSAFITCHRAGCPHAPKLAQLRADVDRMTATAVREADRKREQARDAVVTAACALVQATRSNVPLDTGIAAARRLTQAVEHFEQMESE
jgi:ribosomal protein L37E